MTCLYIKIASFWEEKNPIELSTVEHFLFFSSLRLFLLLLKIYPVEFILDKNELNE